jgi:L-seryl-tRNA(Ser) seleniumtransferase
VRRQLPSVERVLQHPTVRSQLATEPRELIVDAIRDELEAARVALARGEPAPGLDAVAAHVVARFTQTWQPTLRPVINATGVVLHTNLGRAPLSGATLAAMEQVARGYSSLEFDVAAGERGSRHEHVSTLLQRLTGAEAALVVNNNASAVLLTLAGLAAGREVVISRGQLVEIGGGFRIPDVLRQSGAHLIEVGTTNRTYAADYAAAISQETALLLRVHASNFRVVGFVHSATLGEMVQLAHGAGILVVDDLGSGSLLPTETYDLAHEPMVQESVAAGADVVVFSGDKLLGGPQAGILVGTRATIAELRRHPLTRALRPDKATIAGLAATLTHYVRGEALREIPVWRMIATPLATLDARARRLAAELHVSQVSVVEVRSAIGGGSTPEETLPSAALGLEPVGEPPQALAARVRAWRTPVIPRIADGRVLLDLRTVAEAEESELLHAVRAAFARD